MILIRGEAGGTALTGTIFEPGDERPEYRGVPQEDSSYLWVCDEFYEVESGGARQKIGDREVNIAFESPMPRGFNTLEEAIKAAKEHIRTQFARVGVNQEKVEIERIEESNGFQDSA